MLCIKLFKCRQQQPQSDKRSIGRCNGAYRIYICKYVPNVYAAFLLLTKNTNNGDDLDENTPKYVKGYDLWR